jgi:glycosyltransferase involved in cell wall biosynthesis
MPIVVSPHGMVYGQALGQRARLKRLAGLAFQDAIVHRAACVHATAQQEVDEIRRYGYRGPIALVPWGVDVPASPAPRRRDSTRTVAYIGRFHPLKNLDALLLAWARVARDRPEWRLVLAGYDEDGYRAVLEGRAHELGVADRVALVDPVDGDAREAFFASAELTVLPSAAENFAFVVPEALARGIPVVTTTGTPWPALAAEGCGWSVPPSADAIAGALADATSRTPEALNAMGERGRRYVRASFDWTIVVGRLLAVYEWTAGRGSRPADVQVAA